MSDSTVRGVRGVVFIISGVALGFLGGWHLRGSLIDPTPHSRTTDRVSAEAIYSENILYAEIPLFRSRQNLREFETLKWALLIFMMYGEVSGSVAQSGDLYPAQLLKSFPDKAALEKLVVDELDQVAPFSLNPASGITVNLVGKDQQGRYMFVCPGVDPYVLKYIDPAGELDGSTLSADFVRSIGYP